MEAGLNHSRILAFDPRNSLLLLSAPSSSASPNPISTLLINLATALLGGSPAASDLSSVSDGVYLRDSRPPPTIRNNSGGQRTGLVNRERLRLERGEWIVVVGWLEGEGRRLLHQVS